MSEAEYAKNIEEKWAELLYKQKKIQSLSLSLQKLEETLSNQLVAMKKEEKDVSDLEKTTIGNLFNKIAGRMDDVIRKEEREFLEAKVKYEQLQNSICQTKQDLNRTITQTNELDQDIKKLVADAQSLYPEIASQYSKRESQLIKLKSQGKELAEAIQSGHIVLEALHAALDRLDSAHGWATFDIFVGKGLLSHMAKYNSIDDAQDIINSISYYMDNFRDELRDVNMFLDAQMEDFSSGTRFVDYFFDNIFTDIAVRNRIEENTNRLYTIRNKINTIMDKLMAAKQKNEEDIKEMEKMPNL